MPAPTDLMQPAPASDRHAARRGRRVLSRFWAAAQASPGLVVDESLPARAGLRDKVFRRSLLVADVVASLVVLWVTHVLFGVVGPGRTSLVLPLLVPFVYTAAGLYRRDELVLSGNTLDEAPSVFQAATLAAVLAYLIESAIIRTPLGAKLVALSVVGLTAATLLARVLARTTARRLTPPERCLVVGGPETRDRLNSQLATAPAVKAEIVADRRLDDVTRAEGDSPMERLRRLEETVRSRGVERIIVAGDGASSSQVHETIQLAKAIGVKVSVVPQAFDAIGSAVTFDYLGGLTLLGVPRFGLSRRARAVKRTMDVVASAVLLILLAPLFAIIALAIRYTSDGPVLFRQMRVGRDERHFQILKFRTMVADAEARKPELRSLNEADGLFKIGDDPRITWVGRALRRTLLDELPQLTNVFKGEMSLVGPRPLVVEEDRQIRGWHRRRLDLTPGMTGPWQVLGAARIPLREMVVIDYLYVANWSLWGDIKVLLRTVPCMLARRGQ
jgi:exopolysaccharide biosynthesis polyprenyl glycosylphosphotransferase